MPRLEFVAGFGGSLLIDSVGRIWDKTNSVEINKSTPVDADTRRKVLRAIALAVFGPLETLEQIQAAIFQPSKSSN